jgi:hypothetical protein
MSSIQDHEGAWATLRHNLRNSGKSFEMAREEARVYGNYKPLILKPIGVAIGAVILADGIYNLVSGFNEQVEDALLSDKTHRNYVRMWTGSLELAAGAALIYTGLTTTGLNHVR